MILRLAKTGKQCRVAARVGDRTLTATAETYEEAERLLLERLK